MASKKPAPSKGATGLNIEDGPTKYVDRPANEGKHGDGEEQPNDGFPRASEEPEPSEPKR